MATIKGRIDVEFEPKGMAYLTGAGEDEARDRIAAFCSEVFRSVRAVFPIAPNSTLPPIQIAKARPGVILDKALRDSLTKALAKCNKKLREVEAIRSKISPKFTDMFLADMGDLQPDDVALRFSLAPPEIEPTSRRYYFDTETGALKCCDSFPLLINEREVNLEMAHEVGSGGSTAPGEARICLRVTFDMDEVPSDLGDNS